MALDDTALSSAIQTELEAGGFKMNDEDLKRLADAVATAVVNHITSSADVVIPSGSSAGTYPVS